MVLTVSILWENPDKKRIAINFFHVSLWMAKLTIPNFKWINSVKNSYTQHVVRGWLYA